MSLSHYKMGASASAIAIHGKSVYRNQLDPELLKLIGNDKSIPELVTIENLIDLCKTKTDVFLTHNWGEHQDNHHKVAEINRILKQKGLLTWFDDEKMQGNVKQKMVEGIDNASCVVVFITSLYIAKVGGENAEDNCQLEFGYSARRKTGKKMIPVVMESGCRSTASWSGEVGMVLGGMLYVDMCDGVSEAKVSELYDRIMSVVGGMSLQARFDNSLATLTSQGLLVDTTSSESTNIPESSLSTSQLDKLAQWLVHSANIAPKAAEECAVVLLEAKIATVERLLKKWEKNKNLLNELKLDEDDAEDIVKALQAMVPVVNQSKVEETRAPAAAVAVSTVETIEKQVTAPVVQQAKSEPVVAAVVIEAPMRYWRQSTTITGHTAGITCVSVSRDGQFVASSSKSSSILVHTTSSGELVNTLAGHTGGVTSVAFQIESPDYIFSGSADKTIKVWNRTSGSVTSSIDVKSSITTFSCSANDRLLAVAANQDVILYNETDEASQRFKMIEPTVASLSPDGTTLVCCGYSTSAGRCLQLWNTQSNKMIHQLVVNVNTGCWSGDGTKFIFAQGSSPIRVWSTIMDQIIKDISVSDWVRSVSSNADASLIIAGFNDKTVKIWKEGELFQSLKGHEGAVVCVRYVEDSDGGMIVTGSEDKTIRVWRKT